MSDIMQDMMDDMVEKMSSAVDLKPQSDEDQRALQQSEDQTSSEVPDSESTENIHDEQVELDEIEELINDFFPIHSATNQIEESSSTEESPLIESKDGDSTRVDTIEVQEAKPDQEPETVVTSP